MSPTQPSPEPTSTAVKTSVASAQISRGASPSEQPDPGAQVRRPTRAVGLLLGVAAVVLISLVLRPAATSTGPLVDDILAHYGEGKTAAGALTALPPLAFALLGAVAVPLARRGGLTGTILVTLVLTVVGLLLRPSAPSFLLFLAASALALVGPAIGNVLVPAWIKRHGSSALVLLMTLYTGLVAFGGALGSAFAVPLRDLLPGGWGDSLRLWGLLILVVAVVWLLVLRRTGHDFPAQGPTGHVHGSLWRSPTACAMTVMFGLQSMNYYMQAGLLPTILTDAGVEATTAGLATALIAAWSLLGGLAMPTIVARAPRLPLVGLGFGTLTMIGWAGVLLAPSTAPYLWASVLGLGGFSFPMVLALIPARSHDVVITARLSALVQSVGYLMAAIGSLIAGVLLERAGSSAAVLMMLCVGIALAMVALRAAAPRMVDEELRAQAPAVAAS